MRWLPLSGFGKFLAAAVLAALLSGPVAAETIVRSFKASGNIEIGSVVALVVSDKNSVELAPADDPTRIYGVVVESSAAPVTIESPDKKVFVATGGVYPVLVSAESGAIAAGDYLSISSSAGVAAKVKAKQTYVVGRASQSYDSAGIGRIEAQIAPGKNPALREDIAVPGPLRKLGESIAGKPLSASRIYSALIIFLVTAAIAFGLLVVGVHSGMISIGRNPLSKHSIMQNLAQVIAASALVFISGLFGIYLFLRI